MDHRQRIEAILTQKQKHWSFAAAIAMQSIRWYEFHSSSNRASKERPAVWI
jgi:hypothetical protein